MCGKLKGFDSLVNLVLDDTVEYFDTPDGNQETRDLVLIVCRGNSVMTVFPEAGTLETENPWLKG